jgi:heavy metal sensor kinase
MILKSIRWRLQVWHGLLLVLVLTGFGFTAYRLSRDNQLRRVDQELNQRLMALIRPRPPGRHPDGPPEPDAERPPPEHRPERPDLPGEVRAALQQAGAAELSQTNAYYYVLWHADGVVDVRSASAPADVPFPTEAALERPPPPPPPEKGRPGRRPPPLSPPVLRTRGTAREMFRFLPRGECVLVGHSLAPDLAALRRLALWLTMAGAGVLLLGLAGGWWLASRAIRPIEDISATAVKIAGGDLTHRINAADTESELGRLATVLNSTFARLEAAFTQQARFTADASHELRTPVAVILNQTQSALMRDRSDAEYRETLEACQRAAQRMRALTESLLELARLDAGQATMKLEPCNLAPVAQESVELVRPLAHEAGVEVECQLARADCLGDAERIGQVVVNLLNNAIQFNRRGGGVRVSTKADDGAAVLEVTDTGTGIPAEDLPYIFERFYRVDKSRARTQGHAGLGLAICKAIVEAHSGSIAAASQPGAGSTFTVRLPLK